MEVTLTPSMQAFVEGKVSSGEFGSPDDVLRASLGQLMEVERIALLEKDAAEAMYPGLREKIRVGMEQARNGELKDGESFFDSLEGTLK